ncbi:MAG: HDOD domain-containing protein [Pseudomonadota bacterium]|jgi:HD-like signal output (HDOD) protein|nr:HDOD domain-containing protein [Xanthomonadaceae bacterium]MDE2247480.1 HDOD domain-containing protein [Xanthomonadaceae bacterium]MDE3210362.1 HDOD domain-containing protein [Pseudomonadota bacterium]
MASMWRRIFGSSTAAAHRAPPRAVATTRPARAAEVAVPDEIALPALSRQEIGDRFNRFVLGLPERKVDELSPAEQAMLKRLKQLSLRFDMSSLPRLPSVLPQLLRTLKNEDAAGDQLAKLVGRDPLMVGEVMRVTSSVYYRSVQPINSLRQAVVLLGHDGLRQVLTQHVMKPLLQANAGGIAPSAGIRLWEHAERCAHACAMLGKVSGCDVFEAYLAGITSRTGTGAVVRLLGKLMPTVHVPVSAGFLVACEQLAAQLSLQAARHWELPANVTEAMEDGLRPAGEIASSLGRVLYVSDLLAMAQLLRDHDRIPDEIDLDDAIPGFFTPPQLERCQLELRHNFSMSKAS